MERKRSGSKPLASIPEDGPTPRPVGEPDPATEPSSAGDPVQRPTAFPVRPKAVVQSSADQEGATAWDNEEEDDHDEIDLLRESNRYRYDEEYDDEDDDEGDENKDQLPPAPLVVPNDDAELLAFLRTAVKQKTAPVPLADWLAERGDPRAELVQELTTARPVLPGIPPQPHEIFTLVASVQWRANFASRRMITPGRLEKAVPTAEEAVELLNEVIAAGSRGS